MDYCALRTQIWDTLRRKDRNQNPISNKYEIWDFLCLLSRGIHLLKITITCKFQHVFFKRMCTKYTFQITVIFNFLVPFKKDLIKWTYCMLQNLLCWNTNTAYQVKSSFTDYYNLQQTKIPYVEQTQRQKNLAAVFLTIKTEMVRVYETRDWRFPIPHTTAAGHYSHMLLLLHKVPSHDQRIIPPLEVVSWPIVSLTSLKASRKVVIM